MVSPGAEITAFALDLTKKRFVIGDSKGQMKVFNCHNGELLKTLQEHHDGEVLNLTVVKTKEMSMIVSSGTNNVIQIHEDDCLHGTCTVRRTINIANYDIQVTRVLASSRFHVKYIIVGLNKGQIKVYELETGRPDASYPAYSDDSDVGEIRTLKNKPFFLTTDNHGFVTLWIAPPCLNKYQKCYE